MTSGSLVARLASSGTGIRMEWREGRISAMTPADAPSDVWLAPTLFDAQINGYGGLDWQRDDVSVAELETALGLLREHGCGQILLTVVTAPWESILAKFRRYRAAREASAIVKRVVAGWHLEGPFMSPVPGYVGAHNPDWMIDPTPQRLRELRDAAGDLPLLLTLAPERPGAIDGIRAAVDLGMVVSLGHTNASSAELAAAAAAGARSFTHLGNGIPQQLDRHDNLVWRVLDGPPLAIGLIPDAIHVSPTLFRLLHRLGVDAWYTTDAAPAGGMPPGRYAWGGVSFDVGPDQVVREPGKTNFSGSAIAPLQGVFRAARMLDRPWREAWTRFSSAPRRLMGLPEPLVVGQPADFCVVRGADRAESLAVVIDGREIRRHEPVPG